MTGFPKYLLMTFCLCVLSEVNACDYSCQDYRVKNATLYTMNQTVNLMCREGFHGRHFYYLWFKLYPIVGYQRVIENRYITFSQNGALLTYHAFTPDVDAADFKCDIHDGWADVRSKIFRLRRPKIVENYQTDERKTYHVSQYSYLFMRCTFQGEILGDDFQISWSKLKDGHLIPLPDDPDRQYIDISGNLHFTSVLGVDETFNGENLYRCDVFSPTLSRGALGYFASINVTEEPFSWENPVSKYKTENIMVELHQKAVLECVFEDNTLSGTSYRWYGPDRNILTTQQPEKYEFLYQGKRLIIHNFIACDQGFYSCEASNVRGTSGVVIGVGAICRTF